MKALILLLFIVTSFNKANCQTKQETEKWIKDKIINYFDQNIRRTVSSDLYKNKNLNIKFSECQLIITYDRYGLHFSNLEKINNVSKGFDYENTYKYVVSLSEFNELSFLSETLIISVKYRAINSFISKDHGNSFKSSGNEESVFLGFHPDGEKDIKERMIKAFNHLKIFCPQKIRSEVF